MVKLRGTASPADAIRDTAASTGTHGWQTEMTCSWSAPMCWMNSRIMAT
jgi:hypothetical protein